MITIQNMEEYNAYFRQPTLHPLISVGDLSRADLRLFDPIDFGMYCVVLMDEDFGELIKGGKKIKYRSGTLFSLRPGQVVTMSLDYTVKPQGFMLAFRPELLKNTGLGRDFYMFNFFSSDVLEAMELNALERGIILNCFSNIIAELQTPSDYLSDQLLRLAIGQMLSYFKRFYERQCSIVSSNPSLVEKLDSLIDNYLSSGMAAQKGQPTVSWCASQFNLSPNYFGDIVKRKIHITAQEYILQKIITTAKRLILSTDMSISEISEELGFTYPNHFARMFKRHEGVSPTLYRKVRKV